jgi:DNA-binding NarL/FixJ family response regulator
MKKNLNIEKTKKQISVWLVEDNTRYSKTLAGLINRTEGLVCSKTYSNCEDAFNEIESSQSPDVILLDIGLPGMNGIEGISKFKSFFPDVQILILTVYDDNDNVFEALCAGATGYLLKDSSPAKIIDSIREVLAGGVPMNMKIAHKVLEMFTHLKPKKVDYGLTEREKEILQLLTSGLTQQQISEKLFISFFTVNTHLKNIYAKLHVNSRASAVSKVFKENIL